MSDSKAPKIAVIGAGHQGRHHIRFLKALDGVRLAFVVDKIEDRARGSAEDCGAGYSTDHQQVLPDIDAAVIAVPTIDHFSVASDFLQAGKHILVEKPVAASIEECETLADLAQQKGIVAHAGLPERFNPAVERASPSITRPMFIEGHRLGIFSPRSLDVDVVLDLMIHDLDLLHLFLQEEPSDIQAVGIPILSRQIDIANARLKFPGGCVVNLTASRVSGKRMRKIRLFQPNGYLSLDMAAQSFTHVSVVPNLCNAGLPDMHRQEFVPEQSVHPLEFQLKAFRDAILGKPNRGIPIQDSISSLRMALAIKSSFRTS